VINLAQTAWDLKALQSGRRAPFGVSFSTHQTCPASAGHICFPPTLLPGSPLDGSSQFDSCGFTVVAPVTLERVMIDAGSDRLDAGEHHLATTLWTCRPVDGWKPKKNKLVMEHGLLV
jgi:hypothetical protein